MGASRGIWVAPEEIEASSRRIAGLPVVNGVLARLGFEELTMADAASLDQLVIVSLPSMDPLDTRRGGKELVAAVDAYGLAPGDLVVLDSFQRVTAAAENESDTTRAFFLHTGSYLKKRKLTVIRTDNTGKDVKKGARGTSGKKDDVDVEYLMESKGEYIEIGVGKVRQRGITELSLYVSEQDGCTNFRSNLPSPTKTKVQHCIMALDGLGLPDNTGDRKAEAALVEAGHDFTREIRREACRLRQERADKAKAEFAENTP